PTPSPEDIHTCDGAGQWFPADQKQLAKAVDDYLAGAEKFGPEPVALISPHAGYIFSGWVAGWAFKQVEGLSYDTVVVIGSTHSGSGQADIAVWAKGAYETPLGLIPVDEEVAAKLLAADKRIAYDPAAHRGEHPVENQMPFLQRALKGPFKVVPIVMRKDDLETAKLLSDALVSALEGKKALIVASTDLSHWPSYEDAKASDTAMLAAVESLDPEKLLETDKEWMGKGIANLATTMCSKGAVFTAMLTAPRLGADQVKVLKYANSGDTPFGDRSQVVGYGAVMFWHGEAIEEGAPTPSPPPQPSPHGGREREGKQVEPGELDEEDKKELLRIARQTIAHFLETSVPPQFSVTRPNLLRPGAAFVTLKKHGELRGCIGRLIAENPLYLTVQRVAIEAAVADARFIPVASEELKDIELEISVLSSLRQIDSPKKIKVGEHGVILVKYNQQAVFLPQVATEQGWDREEMLANLCLKAGLPESACPEGAQFFIFTADVFSEGE
ncbi:MAG: AmmeMemoRadiSam system protein B, partial [Anaerolineae bacterium]